MPNLLETLDKSDWQTFRFDEIAHNISKRVEPGATDLSIYVGLEHLDSGSVHIKRMGTPADVDGTKLLVYAGDVIFGRRRAYQRKAAVATFDGICSAHALVLRAKPDAIEPRLFPFFLHSDAFMHRVVDISVGGLSPTVNWGHLKVEEFLLPPRDQQARLAELLWAADEVKEGYSSIIEATKATKYTCVRDSVVTESVNRDWLPLATIADLVGGYAFKSDLFSSEPIGTQVLKISNVSEDGFNLSKSPAYISDVKCDDRFWLNEGEIVISLTGSNGKRDFGFAVLNQTNSRFLVNQRLAIVRAKPKVVLNDFLLLMMKHEIFLDKFHQNAIGTANQANVSMRDMGKILLPIPSLDEQSKLVRVVNELNLSIESSEAAMVELTNLKQTIINQIFSA